MKTEENKKILMDGKCGGAFRAGMGGRGRVRCVRARRAGIRGRAWRRRRSRCMEMAMQIGKAVVLSAASTAAAMVVSALLRRILR